jgi:hypothetical protein
MKPPHASATLSSVHPGSSCQPAGWYAAAAGDDAGFDTGGVGAGFDGTGGIGLGAGVEAAGGADGVAEAASEGVAGCGDGWAGALLVLGALDSAGAGLDGRLVAQPASTSAEPMSAALHFERKRTHMNRV